MYTHSSCSVNCEIISMLFPHIISLISLLFLIILASNSTKIMRKTAERVQNWGMPLVVEKKLRNVTIVCYARLDFIVKKVLPLNKFSRELEVI